ncbi:MAG: short-chain dehydrogenase/reductase [Acidimicrobiaceae bacterium]|nr:short-chain dehydrogenase/reductase [Acidimicrobiaceae bacterium]
MTGGAGAIGSAIVRALEESGHRTAVIDRTGMIPCDLGSESSTREAAATVLEQYGRCDVFVQCAAAFDQAALGDLDSATLRHVFATIVESALWLAQAFAPGMAERGFGRIIFMTSDTLWSPPLPTMLPYVASKGAVIGIMRSLAVALGPDGIAVSSVAPGLTDTPGSRTVNSDADLDADLDAVIERQALKRRLTPEDTASAVAYLASDGGAAMTGQILCADGGLILR